MGLVGGSGSFFFGLALGDREAYVCPDMVRFLFFEGGVVNGVLSY